MRFIYYSETDGKILGEVSGASSINMDSFGHPWIEVDEFPDFEAKVVDGQVVPLDPAVVEAREIERAWDKLRQHRSAKLFASDWTQVPDAPVDQAAWATYRQELRDLPENTADPRQVVWPEEPQ